MHEVPEVPEHHDVQDEVEEIPQEVRKSQQLERFRRWKMEQHIYIYIYPTSTNKISFFFLNCRIQMLGSNFKQSAAWLFSNGALMFINSYVDVDVDVDNFHRFFKMHFRLFKLKRDGQSTGEQ